MWTSRSRAISALVLLCCVAAAAVPAAERPASGTVESAAEATAEVGVEPVLAGDGLLEGFSLSADRGPVHIEASSLEFEYRTGELTYRGAVKVSQADITLTSDALSVKLDIENAGRPREIVAQGNVRIVNGDRVATGGRAVFDQEKQTITLSDAAVLRDGPNEVAGDKVVVYIAEQRSVVEGGSDRVRAVLFPGGDPMAAKDDDE